MTEELFQLGYAVENRQLPWQWGYDHVRLRGSPYGDRFQIEETPWLKAPLETLTVQQIQEVILKCCAQGGKTVTMQIAAAWALDQRPGLTLFAAQTKEAAKQLAKERILPTIESVASLAAAMPRGRGRHNKSTLEIYFAVGTLLIGPANESFFRGHTAPWVFGDECSRWDPGKMEQARARGTRVWNRKAFFASTPLEAGDDFDNAYHLGSRKRYHLATPCCGHLTYLTSDNLEKLFRWDVNETTRPAGVWNFGEIRKTVRMVCPKCGKEQRQTEEIYRRMIAGAQYVSENPGAPPEKESFAFNVLCLPPSVMSWASIVEMWLLAKDEEMKGNLAPLKEFVTLRLAETWDPRKYFSYHLPDFEQYDPAAEWPEEKFRCMTVDCQEHLAEFWVVVRAWGRDGSSRLLSFARLHTEEELKAHQKEWKVPAHLVALDCAYMPYRVYDICLRNGWCAMRGDDRTDWINQVQGEDGQVRGIRQPFRMTRGDPRSGKTYGGRSYCLVWEWSNPTIKDLLWLLKEGKGLPWAVCELGPELAEIYAKGLDSERLVEEIDRWGRSVRRWKKRRQNHPWDAELMSVVFAFMARLFVHSHAKPVEEKAPPGNPRQ